jgi:cytochrome b involved in lipid metabolism
MKFKTVTLIVLFLFIAFFAVLAFIPESKNLFKSAEEKMEVGEVENTENTPIEINSENNSANLNTTTDTNSNNSSSNSNSVVLTTAEIAKHNKANDCYLIVKGSVYSVAAFIDKHPGGDKRY